MDDGNTSANKMLPYFFTMITHLVIQLFIIIIIISALTRYPISIWVFFILFMLSMVLAFVTMILPVLYDVRLSINEQILIGLSGAVGFVMPLVILIVMSSGRC